MNIYYSTREIGNVLRSVAKAAEGPGEEQTGFSNGWHAGFTAALVAVGLAFGLQQMVASGERKGPEWIEVERGSDG